MSQGIDKVYNTLVLPCGTSWLLQRCGRVPDLRSKGPWLDPRLAHRDFLRV